MSNLLRGAVIALALLPATLAGQNPRGSSSEPGEVTVTGDVLRPGTYQLTAGMTAFDVLKAAEGSPNDTLHSLVVRYDRGAEARLLSFSEAGPLRANDVVIVRGVYVLRRDQILLIEVENHPDLTGRYLVQDDGTIILPAVGRIRVGNESQFKSVIAAALQAALNDKPRVTVTEVQNRW